MSTNDQRRVALFVFDCEPGAGSDPGLGWQWLSLAMASNSVVVFTQTKNIAALKAAGLPNNVELRGIDTWKVVQSLGKGTPWGEFLRCRTWLRIAIGKARQEHGQLPFDLAHFATFSAIWMPAPFYRLKMPFLSGVMTGAERTHPDFEQDGPPRFDKRFMVFRTLMRLPSWQRSFAKQPALVVGSTEAVGDLATSGGATNVEVFRPPFTLEPVLAAEFDAIRGASTKSQHPSFVVTGRLLGWKGQAWALRAMAKVLDSFPDARMDVIGDGPSSSEYQELAADLGIVKNTTFHGAISREAERKIIASSTALVFPSERDTGGAVLTFAMALGTPIVAFDVGAVSTVVGEAGELVQPTVDPTSSLAAAMIRVIENPDLQHTLREAGLRRLNDSLSWADCQRSLEGWYQQAERLFNADRNTDAS